MEGLIDLVNASFARHGIECPAAESRLDRPDQAKSSQAKSSQSARSAELSLTAALPNHNFSKGPQPDRTP